MKFLIFQHVRVEHPGFFVNSLQLMVSNGTQSSLMKENPFQAWMASMRSCHSAARWTSGRSVSIRGSSLKRRLSGHGSANDESRFSVSALDINCWQTRSAER